MIVVAIILFIVAVALVSIARKKKSEGNPIWILLQLAGSGSGLVSFAIFGKLVGLIG